MGTIVVVALILIFIAMPFATFAKVSSIAAEIRELKIMVKNLGILNVRAEAKSAVEVAPKVERTPGMPGRCRSGHAFHRAISASGGGRPGTCRGVRCPGAVHL